jgi:N-acetylglutamate synthase-like GNAT family acetyltransferase
VKMNYQIFRGKPVKQEEIEYLRLAVGWDKMEGKYDQILQNLYTHYTVRMSGKLVGFLSVLSDGIADAFLIDLMVHPDFRKRGIGTELVKRAIKDLRFEGIKCIQVTFCQDDEPFFKKFGFHIMKAGIIDNDTMDVDF